MAASYRSVNYSLRPGKYAERRMLSEMLQKLHPFGAVESYRYVGMGSVWFSDFLHFHKVLGIKDMISIEREAVHKNRFEFNKPFSSIKMIYESTNTALSNIDYSIRSIFWLDFDDCLKKNILEDVSKISHTCAMGTVLFVSVQTEGVPKYWGTNEDGDPSWLDVADVQELRDRYGAASVPANADNSDLCGWAISKIVRQMITINVEAALAARNAGRPHNQHVEFRQFASFEYADGAKMTTIGGIFVDRGQLPLLAQCDFQQLSYFCDDDSAVRLDVPVLTIREMRLLDSCLPDGSLPKPYRSIVLPSDVKSYSKLYRYLPSFAALES